MVLKPNETEESSLSLRRRVRRFWIEEKRFAHIGRNLLFHAVISLGRERPVCEAFRQPSGGRQYLFRPPDG